MDATMMRAPITNMQKHDNYTEQFKRLKKALANGFHLEAIFIEYTVMEDRTESILRHSDLWDAYLNYRRGRNASIESKIQYVLKYAENKKSLLHKYFSGDLLESILAWKEKRNRLIHALLKQFLESEEIKNIALEGEQLAKTLRTRTESYKRALLKINKTEEN